MGAVPVSTFVYLGISLTLCLFLPIAFLIFLGRRMPVRSKIILTGVITFVVFVILLERFVHTIVLTPNSSIVNNPVYYVIYGCVMAGLFECAAKFIGLKVMVKEPTSPGFALQFGLGYGAAEALLVGVMPLASNLASAFHINKVGFETYLNEIAAQLAEQGEAEGAINKAMETYKANLSMLYDGNLTCLLGGIERVAAIVLQIALTVLIFQALRQGSKTRDYVFVGIAFIAHAFFDFPAAMYQKQLFSNIVMIEVVLVIEAVIAGIIAYIFYKKNVEEFGKPINAQSIYNE